MEAPLMTTVAASGKWTYAQQLLEPDAPRVCTPTILLQWFAARHTDLSRRHLTTLMQQWCAVGVLERVAHGVFLNSHAQPKPRPDEAAPFIRQNAVVSLQRVLGDHGVLNNPTHWITCVVPTASGIKGGMVDTDRHTFQFSTIAPHLLPTPQDSWHKDAFAQGTHTPTATPEKALLDWIYLATVRNGRARPAPPRHDIDMNALDVDRVARLAAHMCLTEEWHAWMSPPSLVVSPRIK